MEVNRKNVIDVSSFFFFEATGDSDQADTFNDPNVSAVDQHPDDDAESCSCDISDNFPLFVTGHHNDHHHLDGNGCDDRINRCDSRPCSTVDDEEEEEGEEAHSYCRWSWNKNNNNKKKKKKKKEKKRKKNGVERVKKSSESVDSSEQVLSEQEKNRLFWETCLAS